LMSGPAMNHLLARHRALATFAKPDFKSR